MDLLLDLLGHLVDEIPNPGDRPVGWECLWAAVATLALLWSPVAFVWCRNR